MEQVDTKDKFPSYNSHATLTKHVVIGPWRLWWLRFDFSSFLKPAVHSLSYDHKPKACRLIQDRFCFNFAFVMKLPKRLDKESPRAELDDRNKAFNTLINIPGRDARSTL